MKTLLITSCTLKWANPFNSVDYDVGHKLKSPTRAALADFAYEYAADYGLMIIKRSWFSLRIWY